jgi:hypothetical protein
MGNDSLYQIHAQFVSNNKINKTNARKCISLDIFWPNMEKCQQLLCLNCVLRYIKRMLENVFH